MAVTTSNVGLCSSWGEESACQRVLVMVVAGAADSHQSIHKTCLHVALDQGLNLSQANQGLNPGQANLGLNPGQTKLGLNPGHANLGLNQSC